MSEAAVERSAAAQLAATPPIYLINLDRDADRLAHMTKQFSALGLPFERFPAVRGDALPESVRAYFLDDGGDPVVSLSAGETGCYASHLVLLQRVAESDAPALILEDDTELPPDFPALIAQLLASAPEGWDLIRLSNTAKRAYGHVAALPNGRAIVRYSQVPGSTGASLISASGARKFLAPKVRNLPVDQDLRRVWVWGLNIYGVAPTPVRADIFEASSIDAMAPKGTRKQSKRLARMRRARSKEAAQRHALNRKLFGVSRWLGTEAVNAVVTITPQKLRPKLLLRASRWLRPKEKGPA